LSRALKRLDFKVEGENRQEVTVAARDATLQTILVASVSRESGLDSWRKLGAAAVKTALKNKATALQISLRSVSKLELNEVAGSVVEGINLALYRFDRYKQKKSPPSLKKVTFLLREKPSISLKQQLERGRIIAESVNFARDLVNTSPRDLLPKDLVAAARTIKGKLKRSKIRVYGENELKKMKANLILAVSSGSDSSPYLIHLSLPSSNKKAKKVVLLGKGVTFDSGGLSIKPGKGMEDMKCDMSGAAATLAAFLALGRLNLKGVELHAVVPTTENLVSARSTRPGDIIRSMNGKSVEILNTDAEGRLILADALTYIERLKPDYLIDLATLTGACVVALGELYAGLFTEDENLKSDLLRAASASGELLWPLPLAKEYAPQLKSEVADLKNIGAGTGAGATLGALFLKEFVPAGVKWAHLDIAGPAFLSKATDYSPVGATGYGVRTLIRFVESL
jgi:leucyl aminopeptidase